eukprot:4005558-Ditylum_brightwellii.AAC.1
MKNEICHCSRKLLINFNNDAEACYDRIIPNIANLIGGKKGLTQNLMFVHDQTLEEVTFKLKTALGVCDEFYQHCQAFPIYGMGQGSTNSPTIWVIISSMIFDIHDELGNGANLCDPLQCITVHVSMVGFAYDTADQTKKIHNNHATPEQLIELMQHDAQLWSELLWVLGGLLELDKCLYHFIYYCFLAD